MALYCPNKNLKEWKDLESSVGEDKAMLMWHESEGQIGYSMKATDIVTKNISKINGWFKQIGNTDVFWNKIQKDLGIPKEQVELFKNSKGNTIEEKLVSFASDYSYTVEINTAKDKVIEGGYISTLGSKVSSMESRYGKYYYTDERGVEMQINKTDWETAKQIFDEYQKGNNRGVPTQYYSNRTVPGGTNYIENEISTPAITPSIKGHAQFATNKGIGWFRSDEQAKTVLENYYVDYVESLNKYVVRSNLNDKITTIPGSYNSSESAQEQADKMNKPSQIRKLGEEVISSDGKTRRVLEVQSDLFQKGRDKSDLTSDKVSDVSDWMNQNKFLQLLNKDNNWVTFFVKSIIQDSAKKGYEKVVFPSGDTASKVEGHTTLEEFKKQKEDRIKELEKIDVLDEFKKIYNSKKQDLKNVQFNIEKWSKDITAKDDLIAAKIREKELESEIEDTLFRKSSIEENKQKDINNEITQLKQELERVEKEGFGALKPIYSFYENNISNILKKQGYNPKQVTDEYGNTWNEVTIGEKESKTILLKEDDKITKVLLRYGINQSGFSTAYSTSKQQLADALKNAGAIGYEVKKAYNGNLYVVNNNGKIIKPFIEESSEKSEINQLFPESDTTSNANMIEIIKNNGTEIEKEIVSLLSDFIDETTPVDFVDVVDADNSQGSFEYYKGKPGEIKIRNGVNNVPRVYIHELTHEATSKLVDEYLSGDKSKLSKEQLEAASNIAKLYFELKKNYDVGEYGFRNIHEFISEVWSNKEFQNKLNKIEYKNSNAFSKFLEFVSKLLGLNKNSALSEALNESFALMNAPKISNKIGMESGVFKLGESKKYGQFQVFNSMPFQESTIERMSVGDQRITIRTRSHKDGIYVFNGEQYHIMSLGLKKVSEFKNKEYLKKKFKGDDYEEGRFEHIDDFFNDKRKLYVYQITKIDNKIKNEAVELNDALEEIKPSSSNKTKVSNDVKDSPFEEQFVFFKRRISTLEKQLSEEAKGSVKALKLEERISALSTKLDKAYKEQDEQAFTELGMMALAEAEDYINKVEAVPSKANKDNLLYAVNILQSFYEFDNLATESRKLFKRAFPLILSHNLKTINQFASEGFEITENMINAQVKDIGTFKSSVGALADLANYIGRTIGSLIKAAQNRASTANKLYKNEVQKHVDALTIYAKENGKTLEQVYDMFINETKDDIRLIQSEIYVDGEAVPNAEFDKIKSSKTLLDFYLFYQESLKNADSNLPYKVGKHHIPNINKANSIVYDLTHVLAKHNVLYDQFKSNEELYADMVPQQYRNRLSKDKKSRDLGASLLDFVAYSNNYNELSKVLAEARLLQEQLKWVRSSDGSIKKREFTKSSQPDVRIFAEQTNLWKMINTVIDMQLKGHMTKKEGEIKGKKIYDAEGNEIGYEARYWSDVADVGLKYNSLLKIGLSPITAVTNILFGDISNVIEAVGGRYFGMKDLAVATNIFGANALTKDSLLFKYLERINPLQELDDYNLTDKVKLKKMSAQKLQEYMYSMQKKGELFLQSRTMLAVMLKEGYIDNSGKLTSEGEKMMKDEARVTQFSDKIQRINQLIHGRYSSREAAAMQQSVFYRLAMQFRKWMPSAIESRVGEKQYDNRLGMEIEGRYLTLARLVASKDVFNNLIKMSKGELSELEMYNMRKNLIELTLLAATLFAYLKLTEGDDEEDKKRRKNPYVKLGLTLLNRISGDLEFFYNPSNIVSLTSNSIPLASVAKDLIKTVGSLPSAFYYGDYEYKAGSLKGRNKFWANLTKITPGARPVQDVWKIINKNPLDF
jgi:hypothetical protein